MALMDGKREMRKPSLVELVSLELKELKLAHDLKSLLGRMPHSERRDSLLRILDEWLSQSCSPDIRGEWK